ncbi:COP9 signalosome complex subunit 8 [Sitodiplosis mosellana]|uniref:COP9 signalosome complex subunit 8 n=1 Tax=Sitodiplosis mosellana TaxID=263140 RepID=UPI00244456D2|nr:COP9 signalosome complex subunit 8 [Sitodiplosis mosellana]
MLSSKIEQLIVILENQELDSPNGVTPQLYAELMAAYLYKNDLSSARFLWKRIPLNVKTGNIELEKIHSVYICLWNNDIAGFFKIINYEWSNNIAELMFELREKTYKETVDLIAKAYTSLFEDFICNMLNQTPDVITELCKNLEWEIEDGNYPRLIKPRRPPDAKVNTESAENLLAKLTDFVSFLEN